MKLKQVAGIVSALAIMAVLSGGVYAQTANSGSSSTSGASAGSQSSSGAVAVTGPSNSSSSSSSQGGAGGAGGAGGSAQGGNATGVGGASNATGQGGSATTGNATSNTGPSNANNRNRNTNTASPTQSNGLMLDQRSYGGGRSDVNYSGGTTNYSNERNTGDVVVRTTPTVYAPPVSGGNPCTLAVSGGVSVIGWGASAGGTFVDEDCANRQKIAMIHNAGRPDLAFELMCNDKATYIASRATPKPCSPRPQWDGAPPTMVQQPAPPVVITPVSPPPAPMAAKDYPRCNPARGITDNCRS